MNAHPIQLNETKQRSSSDLANEDTPFIRNCWYAVCFSSDLEVGRLVSRVLLGQPIVLYRKTDGGVVAMKDRCPHRSFPLSSGKLAGDEIVCGYHGMRYGPDGRCTLVPTLPRAPAAISVQTFKVEEQSPLIWIWMGSPEAPGISAPPSESWMRANSGWVYSHGYLKVASNYVYLHENLLDLSHLTFLHERTFGTPDYALAPYETEITDEMIRVKRTVAPTRLPPIYADPLGLNGVDAARIVTSTYLSPGLSISAVVLRDLSKPEAERQDHHIRTAQLVTPADRDTVHYHFLVGRDFATESPHISEFILEAIKKAFAEDVFALESMARIRRQDNDKSFVEYSVPADRAGVTLRRRLRIQAMLEQSTSAAGPYRAQDDQPEH